MGYFEAFILALIQGLTEFLPVSSSAHLILPAQLLGWQDQGLAFDVAVHLGTLLAVLLYYRSMLTLMVGAATKGVVNKQWTPEAHQLFLIVLGTIPAGLVGVFLGDWIELNLRSVMVIASATILFGVLLAWSDKKSTQTLQQQQLNWRHILLIGIAQAFALIPGTSRSGITITAALLLGYRRTDAANISFLLSIPIILAAGSLKAVALVEQAAPVNWSLLCFAALISMVSAWCCIRVFIALLDRIGMMPFVWYRLALGVTLFGLIGLGLTA